MIAYLVRIWWILCILMQKVGKKWVKCGLNVGGFDWARRGVIWGARLENRRFCKEKGAVTSSLERLFFLT